MKFIQARQQGSNKIGMSYRVMNGNYFSCANWMDERMVNCARTGKKMSTSVICLRPSAASRTR